MQVVVDDQAVLPKWIEIEVRSWLGAVANREMELESSLSVGDLSPPYVEEGSHVAGSLRPN